MTTAYYLACVLPNPFMSVAKPAPRKRVTKRKRS